MAEKQKYELVEQAASSGIVTQELIAMIPECENKESILKRELASLSMDIKSSEHLQACTQESLSKCLRETISMGLRIGSAYKEAYVIAGYNAKLKQKEAQIRIGYTAYVNKGFETYGITFAINLVSKEEIDKGLFKYDPATRKISHKWDGGLDCKVKTEADISHCYVVATMADGRTITSEPYTKEELHERARQKKKDYKTGKTVYYWGNVWNSKDRSTDFGEMIKKTALKLFCKTLPQATLNKLAEIDNRTTHLRPIQEVEEVGEDVIALIDGAKEVVELNAIWREKADDYKNTDQLMALLAEKKNELLEIKK